MSVGGMCQVQRGNYRYSYRAVRIDEYILARLQTIYSQIGPLQKVRGSSIQVALFSNVTSCTVVHNLGLRLRDDATVLTAVSSVSTRPYFVPTPTVEDDCPISHRQVPWRWRAIPSSCRVRGTTGTAYRQASRCVWSFSDESGTMFWGYRRYGSLIAHASYRVELGTFVCRACSCMASCSNAVWYEALSRHEVAITIKWVRDAEHDRHQNFFSSGIAFLQEC